MSVIAETIRQGKMMRSDTLFDSGEFKTIHIQFNDKEWAYWRGTPECFQEILNMFGAYSFRELIDKPIRAGANNDNACVIGHPNQDKWVEGLPPK